MYLNRKCPSCVQKIECAPEIGSKIPAERMLLEDLSQCWNGLYKEKVFFTYYRCSKCGLLFNKEYFDDGQLSYLYSKMPPNMDDVEPDALQKTQSAYFKSFEKYIPGYGGFLEIGPDVGLFLKDCVKNKNFEKYWLFEPNEAVEESLRSIVGGRNFTISREMTSFQIIPDGSLSTVVMIHVFDHLIDPVKALVDLRKKLTKDAKIMIVTHDESSLLRRVLKAKWPPFCLQHPQIYSGSSIKSLVSVAGFRVVKQIKTKNYFSIRFLIKNIFWLVGIKLDIKFLKISVGLRLGNIMTIIEPI